MVVEMLWSTDEMDATPWTMSHMVAAVITGPESAQSHQFDLGIVAIALATHYVLGVIYGTVLAVLLSEFHFNVRTGQAVMAGAIYGMALYLFNFYGMTCLFFFFVV